MLFSVYYQSAKKTEADEIRLPLNKSGYLASFIRDHPEKRYVIVLDDTPNLSQLQRAREFIPSYTVECKAINTLKTLKAQGYNAFMRYPATDWELFHNLKHLGVSDIYIDGPLCFQMADIAKTKEGVKIRISPTVSPNNSMNEAKSPNEFFVRPEDLSLYTEAVDVIDFKVNDQNKEDALFSIYRRGTFTFPISNLVTGLPSQLNNVIFKSDFAETRLNCGQRCHIPSRTCYFCENYIAAAQKLQAFAQDSKKN